MSGPSGGQCHLFSQGTDTMSEEWTPTLDSPLCSVQMGNAEFGRRFGLVESVQNVTGVSLNWPPLNTSLFCTPALPSLPHIN